MKTIGIALGLLCLSVALQAQYSVSKLRLIGKQVLEISETDIQIDTLIMDDKSRIVFLSPETNLVIKNAFIGERCIWDASGKSGELLEGAGNRSPGDDGLPGRNLHAKVTFRYLGNLRIDVSGGTGKLGRSSTAPEDYDGMQGGNGGDGGVVSLTYGSSGLPISFNEGEVRSIYVNLEGGRGNRGGLQTVEPFTPSKIQPRHTSQNASWDLWGNQKAAAAGDLTPRLSREQNGGTGDIPQPRTGVAFPPPQPSMSFTNPEASRSTIPRQSGMGIPGRNGSLFLKKID